MTRRPAARAGRLVAGATWAVWSLLTRHTDSDVPTWDALTTSLSLVAQLMLSFKWIGNWVLWIAADVLYAPSTSTRGSRSPPCCMPASSSCAPSASASGGGCATRPRRRPGPASRHPWVRDERAPRARPRDRQVLPLPRPRGRAVPSSSWGSRERARDRPTSWRPVAVLRLRRRPRRRSGWWSAGRSHRRARR